ncbi:MAG: bifunctional phosphoribosylaminoimidazolecarboxamide formyltransferase/IMP cyclohydrolase [Cyclobacteriaceae bacterium]|nr:bifunctional phosphoribosylaminoimidazolecarboxamide formyltransferase/IMP cyclohydrolase [Cyclobacteriaceae bacterium]
MSTKLIKSALISVYYKDELAPVVEKLNELGVVIYSTGGTQKFIEDLGHAVSPVEELTGYPSILGGRVKTLHPKVFGGILGRRDQSQDLDQLSSYEIPEIDLVIVDLYPFEETVAAKAGERETIEKIDIGGISLIRAAAKNYQDVLTISSREQYGKLLDLLKLQDGSSQLSDRKYFAACAFEISSHYDTQIFNYFNEDVGVPSLKISENRHRKLRYGENPHQEGYFFGKLERMFDQLHGKELSYNNLVDIEAAVALIGEFTGETAFAILKHTNACGMATGTSVAHAYKRAFAADTVSAFGGILITNEPVDLEAALAMKDLFFEVLIAPDFSEEALEVLKQKKKRILLKQKDQIKERVQIKNLLNGFIVQERDLKTDGQSEFEGVTERQATADELQALVFASKVAKHTKSNTIVLAKAGQLLASGVGQTSRVDALKQAIEKAKSFDFDLQGAVMASDAFFPFPDCVEIAGNAGITAIVQPGGSIRDQDSVDSCNRQNISMVFTGVRHFKH